MSNEDRDLQTLFDTLRESDAKIAAGFGVRPLAAAFNAAPRRRTPKRLWRYAAAFAVLLTVIVTTSHRRQLPIEQLSQWRSPTESLLEVPKSPLMTTAPSITR